MNINILRFVNVAFAFLLPLAAVAQNLDPTVEVSRTYEGRLMEVHKPQLKMEVPDSVLRFDLDFDYSVTDTPYRGTYEFKPYSVRMKPAPAASGHKSLYLKAGAGYQLHPVFDLVWSPKFKTGAFRMDVYASHNSFVGNYWKMAEPSLSEGIVVLDRMGTAGTDSRTWYGYDMDTRAGVKGKADWEKGLFHFDLGYMGIHQRDSHIDMLDRYWYSLDARAGLASKKKSGFLYKVDLAYAFSEDDLSFMNNDSWYQRAWELDVESSWGYVIGNGDRIVLEVDMNTASMAGAGNYHGTDGDLVPHYVMDRGRWHFDIGLRISAALSGVRAGDLYKVAGQYVYPDVRIEYKAVRDALKLYLDLGGDSWLNSYSDLIGHNRHAYTGYNRGVWELMDVSEEKVNAVVGAEGRIGYRLTFDLKGGYVKYANMLMDGGMRKNASSVEPALWRPTLGYGSYDKAFVALDWLLDFDSVRFDGYAEYVYAWTDRPENVKGLFMPAAVTGDVALTYDWKDRIYAGVDCEFSSSRKGGVLYADVMYGAPFEISSAAAEIPGYADLGINLKYVVNRRFSVWARGGNLLGMTIQRDILYAEKGPYFTAGICLNL